MTKPFVVTLQCSDRTRFAVVFAHEAAYEETLYEAALEVVCPFAPEDRPLLRGWVRCESQAQANCVCNALGLALDPERYIDGVEISSTATC